MRIALLGAGRNRHLQRWASWLAGHGHAIAITSADEPDDVPPSCQWLPPRWGFLLNAYAFGLRRSNRSAELYRHHAIRPVLAPWKPDIVHAFDALNFGHAAVAIDLPGILRVVEPFGSDIFHGWRAGPLEELLVRRALREADLVTCNLPSIAAYLGQTFGITPRFAAGFSWGVDRAIFNTTPSSPERPWRTELGIPADAVVLLSPRGMRTYQELDYWGAEDIFAAWAGLAREHPRLHLVALCHGGDGAIRQRCLAHARDAASRLHLLDHPVSAPDLAALFRACNLFVSVPHTDLLAQSVLEALACGLPGVVAGCPDFTLLTSQGFAVRIVPSRDPKACETALRGLLTDPPSTAGHAAAIATHHDWERQAPLLEAAYAGARERKGVPP